MGKKLRVLSSTKMGKKISFNEDGTTVESHVTTESRIIPSPLTTESTSTPSTLSTPSTSSTLNGKKRTAEALEAVKAKKWSKKLKLEKEFLEKKYGENVQQSVSETDYYKANSKTADIKANSKEESDINNVKEKQKESGDGERNHAGESNHAGENAGEKARLAALQYLDQWTNDKSNWKFQKLRQIWLIENMYFSHQLDNEGFRKCMKIDLLLE